jgi:hypothetical protein
MDHRPFEDWLLEDPPLTGEQKRQLQAHLRSCPTCAALHEVNLALAAARPVAPAAGFRARFQVRLAAHKAAQRRRLAAGLLSLSVGVTAILFWLAWPVVQALGEVPSNFLSVLFNLFVQAWISFQAYRDTLATVLRVLDGFIPGYVRVLVTMMAVSGGLMWIVSLMKFTRIPQRRVIS